MILSLISESLNQKTVSATPTSTQASLATSKYGDKSRETRAKMYVTVWQFKSICTASQAIFAAFHTAWLDLPFFKLVSFSRSCYKSYTVLEEEVQVLMAHRVLPTVRHICP